MATGDDKEQGAKATRRVRATSAASSGKKKSTRRRPPPLPSVKSGRRRPAAEQQSSQPTGQGDIEAKLGAEELIEPAEPPTPPPVDLGVPGAQGRDSLHDGLLEPGEDSPITIQSRHRVRQPSSMASAASQAAAEGPPITIEPRREIEHPLTLESQDVVVDETNRLPARGAPIQPGESIDVPIDVELPVPAAAESPQESAPAAQDVASDAADGAADQLTGEGPLAPALTASADSVLTSLHAFVEQELDHADPDDRRTRAMLLFEMGHLEEVVYRDDEQSLRRYEQALAQDEGYVPVLRALRRRYADVGRWSDYARVLQAEVDVSRGERERAMLLALHGEVLWRRLQQTERAVESLEAALTLVPRSRRALEVLRAIFSEMQRWEQLLAVLRQMANITTDSAERARLTVEMAEICELRLENAPEAEELYAQALELDSGNEKALVELRRLYLLHRRWQRLSELLAREAGQEYEPSEMYADLYRAARIAETHLHDDARAASLLETVAALRPADALPLQALSEIYQRTGRSEDLAAALSRQARLARDPGVRADLYYRMGQLYQDWLGRPEKALEIYRQALKDQPSHEATLRALSELYRRLECWEDLLDVELLVAERHQDTGARADGYLRAARLCEVEIKDSQRAMELYERSWRVHRGQLEAFRALDRLYRGAGRWDALANLCEERAGLTGDAGLVATLLREAARILEERLDRPEAAIAALERLRETQPHDREAMMQLARLYEAAARPDDLRRILEHWAEQTEDEAERAELRRRLAELLEHTQGQPEMAAAIYGDMLVQDPHDDVARDRLKATHERAGRWNELVEVLSGEASQQTSPSEEAALLLQIGRLYEDRLGDASKAREAYERALARDRSCTPAAVALEDSLRRGEQWSPLVDLLVAQAESARDSSFAAAALCRAAEVREERLVEREQAVALYSRALDLDPQCEPARQGLERIYLLTNDATALESQYLREAEEAGNPLLRVRAHLRLAALLDRGADQAAGAAAADAYEAALKIVEDQPDALNGLAALCRRRGKWQRLAQLLGRIAASAADRATALSALKEWAAILETHQSEEWDPTPIYERILDGDPQDPNAIDALERMAYQSGDGDSLIRLAVLQMEIYGDKSWVAALCMRAALVSVAADRSSEAVELLRRALAGYPRYLPAIRLLRRLQEQLGQHEEVAQLLLQEAEFVASPVARNSALHRAATIMLQRLNQVDAARQALERVFGDDPRHQGAFELLAGLLRSAQDWRVLVDVYRRRLGAVDAERAGPLQLDLAEIYHEQLGDPSSAIQVLAELLVVDPESAAALEEIARLCVDQGRWREAEEYLGRLAGLVHQDPDLRRRAFFQRVDLLADHLAEEDSALEALQELLQRERADREALERIVRICRRRGDWDQTVRALEELARSGSPGLRVASLVDLAEICTRSLNDSQRAAAALSDAARLCLDDPDALGRLASYYERRGDFDGYAQLLASALERLPPEGARGAVALRLARSRLLAGRLLRPEEAEQEVREALRLEPNSLEARLELAGLYLWGDRLEEAALDYRRALELDPMSVAAFRGLYRVNERAGEMQQAGGAAQIVCALSQPSEAEREAADALSAEIDAGVGVASGALEVESYLNLLADGEVPHAALALVRALAGYLPQLGLEDAQSRSVGALMPLEPQDPLAQRCSQLARLLGAEEMACYSQPGLSSSGEVRLTPSIGLVLSAEFAASAPAAQLRFVAGRAAGAVVSGTAYAQLMPARSLELVLAAAVEPFERGFGAYLDASEQLEAMVRQLNRAIPRKVRRTLEQPARAYVAEGPLDVGRVRVGGERAAARAGLVFAGDVGAVLAVLQAEGAERHVRADLLRFSVSKALHEVRRRLGLYR